jgi:hypothetical protein
MCLCVEHKNIHHQPTIARKKGVIVKEENIIMLRCSRIKGKDEEKKEMTLGINTIN